MIQQQELNFILANKYSLLFYKNKLNIKTFVNY